MGSVLGLQTILNAYTGKIDYYGVNSLTNFSGTGAFVLNGSTQGRTPRARKEGARSLGATLAVPAVRHQGGNPSQSACLIRSGNPALTTSRR